MNKNTRFICHFDKEEELLISFAMKCTGLNKTSTIRLMMRRGIIDLVQRYYETGYSRLDVEMKKFIDEF